MKGYAPRSALNEKEKAMKTQRRNFLSVYFLSILVVAGTISLLAGPALAGVLTFNFTGTITDVTTPSPYGLSVNVGDPVTGRITYDTSLPPAYDTGSVAGYIQPLPSGMSVVVAGVTIQSQNYNSFQVLNNAYGVDNINGGLVNRCVKSI
jgi:hypothetical protein